MKELNGYPSNSPITSDSTYKNNRNFGTDTSSCFDSKMYNNCNANASDSSSNNLFQFRRFKQKIQNTTPITTNSNDAKSYILSAVNATKSKLVNLFNDELKYSTDKPEKPSDSDSVSIISARRERSGSIDSLRSAGLNNIISSNPFSKLGLMNELSSDNISTTSNNCNSLNKAHVSNIDNIPDDNTIQTKRLSMSSIFSIVSKNDDQDSVITNNFGYDGRRERRSSIASRMMENIVNSLNDERLKNQASQGPEQKQKELLNKEELSMQITTLKHEIGSLVTKLHTVKLQLCQRGIKQPSIQLKEVDVLNREIKCRRELLRELSYELRDIIDEEYDNISYDEVNTITSINNKEELDCSRQSHNTNGSKNSFRNLITNTGCISSKHRVSFTTATLDIDLDDISLVDDSSTNQSVGMDNSRDQLVGMDISRDQSVGMDNSRNKPIGADEIARIDIGAKYQKRTSASNGIFKGNASNKVKMTQSTTFFGPGA